MNMMLNQRKKKSALKENVRKKIIKDKNWSMLRKMFNESPPVRAIQICIFFLLDTNSILHGI